MRTEASVLDTCPGCGGMWFDADEFVAHVNRLVLSPDIAPEETTLFKRRRAIPPNTMQAEQRTCPKCRKKMSRINYAYDSNVFLDRCPGCSGIWADPGELVNVARYSKTDPRAIQLGEWLVRSSAETHPDEIVPHAAASVPFFFFPRLIVPIADDAPRRTFPIVTVSIIAVSTIVLLLRLFSEGRLWEASGPDPVRIFTFDFVASIFSQQGVFHLLWNMLFLWLFGDNVEDRFGHFRFLIFYLWCAALPAVLYSLIGSNLALSAVGASAAVSATMGAYFVFYPAARLKVFAVFNVIEVPAALCLALWFVFQLFYPILSKGGATAWAVCLGDVGAFVMGALIAFAFRSIPRPAGRSA